MKIVDAKTMRSLDRAATKKCGISGLRLMENAGSGVAELAAEMLEERGGKKVSIFVGKGNNGGDGFVVARHLAIKDYTVRVFSAARIDDFTGEAAENARVWHKTGGETSIIRSRAGIEKVSSYIKSSDLVVDALLGTGLSSKVKGVYAAFIDTINSLGDDVKVLSIDVPSGIDATSGAVLGSAVRADVTATMALPKLGLYLYPGREFAGSIEVVDIGLPEVLLSSGDLRWEVTTASTVEEVIRPRSATAHKGSNGHLAVIAGSTGKTGAAYMASMGAMRSGAGLVTLGLPVSLNLIMEVKTTEVMTWPLAESVSGANGILCKHSLEGALKLLEGKDALVLGPGLGDSKDVAAFVGALLKTGKLPPAILDADALNALGGSPGVLKKIKSPLVLTPHPGEMARLMNCTVLSVEADRVGYAEKLAKRTGAVVVLKGAPTIVAAPDGRVGLNPTGSPALATAGTGDVLSGIIGALLARGTSAWNSARAAVYIHGLGGERFALEAGGSEGMVATDLLGVLPLLLNSFARGFDEPNT